MGTPGAVGDERPARDVLDTPAAGRLVIRGGALRIASFVVGVGISVATVALLIRQLGAGDYGRYVTVVSLVTLVGALAEAGMTNLGIREYTTLADEERDDVMRSLLGLRIALSVLGVFAGVLFAAVAGYSDTMVVGTVTAGFGLLLTNLQGAYSVPLASRLALGRVSILEVARQVFTLVATVALVAAGAGLLAFLAVPLPVGVAVLGLTLWWVRRSIPLLPAFDRARWMTLLRHSASFAVAAAVGTIYIYVIVIVMSLTASEKEVGYFGASFRVFIVLGSIAGLVVTSAFPVLARAARDDRTRLAYALQRLFDVSLVVGAWMAVSTVVGAKFAIDVLAGPGFGPAVGTLRIQGVAVFASFLLATWAFALVSLHRHRALLLANAFALFLSLTLSLILVSPYGAHGAAVATIVGETGLATAYAISLMRHDRDLRPELRVAGPVAAAAALAAAAGLLLPIPSVAGIVVATAVYGAVVVALRAIPAELIEAIPRRRR
jgi:O-antigen/teichoic acid export membrane protein